MQTLPLYAKQVGFTSAGRHAASLTELPGEVAALAAVAQGLVIHEHLAYSYGVTIEDTDRGSVHLRAVTDLLDRVLDRDARPLDAEREPAARIPGNCRHYTVLLVSMLRAHGVPARARCGFGMYFGTGGGEDHWVCEYWRDGGWHLADAQIDAHQLTLFPIDFDLTDVPREEFLVAGEAWRRCRAGEADPMVFGLGFTEEAGFWWIAGNLMRDLAALNNVEMLPWDAWGAMPGPDDRIDEDRVALFDRVAALTVDPDDHAAELRRVFAADERLRVPPTVHNVLLSRNEKVSLDLAGA